MSRRKHNTSDNINYKSLTKNDFNYYDDSAANDQTDGLMKQFTEFSGHKSPWKAILFIIFFFIAGLVCLSCSILIAIGYISEKYNDRAWPLLILGTLMFIPGGYYSYILSNILMKRNGFTLDDIPEM